MYPSTKRRVDYALTNPVLKGRYVIVVEEERSKAGIAAHFRTATAAATAAQRFLADWGPGCVFIVTPEREWQTVESTTAVSSEGILTGSSPYRTNTRSR